MQSKPEKKGLSPKDKGIITIIAFVIVVLLMLAAITFMFRVDTIIVKGSSSYTAEQIKDAAQIQPGENLLAVDTAAVSARIQKKLFNVENVKVSRALLHSVVLDVEPAKPLANFITPKGVYIISEKGKVMLITNKARAGLYNVVGTDPCPALLTGDRFTSNDERKDKVIDELLAGIQASDTLVAKNITLIDVQSFSNVVVTYNSKIDVALGTINDLEYKFEYASNLISGSVGDKEGIIKFQTDPSRASYIDKSGLDYNDQVYKENIESYRAETIVSEEEDGEEGGEEGDDEEEDSGNTVNME